jgi:hypothetical protein
MKHDYVIRPYQKGDEGKIFELWQAVYPSSERKLEEWLKWWGWMYLENPAGRSIIRVAEADSRIIAHHAVVPIKFQIGHQVILGSWGVDAMTHPDYRRLGIFERICNENWAEAASIGIDITPGFPNQYSRPLLIKNAGWFEVAQMKQAIKPLNWEKTFDLKIKSKFLSGILAATARGVFDNSRKANTSTANVKIERITSFNEQFSELWEKVAQQHPIMTARTGEYLNWRFSRPDIQYEILAAEENKKIVGYVVMGNGVLKTAKVVQIVDIAATSKTIMEMLISESIKVSRLKHADILMSRFIAGKSYTQPFRANGFVLLPFVRNMPFCARINSERFSRERLQDSRNWLVQLSDSDII